MEEYRHGASSKSRQASRRMQSLSLSEIEAARNTPSEKQFHSQQVMNLGAKPKKLKGTQWKNRSKSKFGRIPRLNQHKSIKSENGNSFRNTKKNTKMSRLSSDNETFHLLNFQPYRVYPFYYIVPETPSLINVLPPGKYLVIPQNEVYSLPLSVVYHPLMESHDNNNHRDREENRSNRIKKRSNNMNVSKINHFNAINDKSYKNNVLEKSESASASLGESSVTIEMVKELSTDANKELSDCDISGHDPDLSLNLDAGTCYNFPGVENDSLKDERSKQLKKEEQSFKNEERERDGKIGEIFNTIMLLCPQTDPYYLCNKIPEIIDNDDALIHFIQAEKLKAKNRIFQKLKKKLNDVEMSELDCIIDRFMDESESKEENILVDDIEKEILEMRKTNKIAQQLQIICSALPDVDLSYVMSRLDEDYDNCCHAEELLEELLEDRDYPKDPEFDSITRSKLKLWKYYVADYSIENYLKKVPDPEGYFSGPSNVKRNMDREAVLAFLASRYPDLDNFQLDQAFDSCNSNIVNTCKLLDKNYLYDSSIYDNLKKENIDENFLQQIVFVVRRNEILEYLDKEKERKEEEFQRALQENGFFECICCFDSTLIPSEVVICPDGHITCRSCLIQYIDTSYGEGKLTFPCISEACNTEYSMTTLESVLRPPLILRISQRRAADDVDKAAVSGLEKCPLCDYAYVPAPDDRVFNCLNEDCMSVTCRLCKELSHIPFPCKNMEKKEDLMARLEVEEAMSEKLIRVCPNCGIKFVKTDGCNKISCICGTICCYLCLKKVNGYSHFNGNGGLELHKCPLYSNNDKLHVDDVYEAGVQKKKEILKKNPNITFKSNPTSRD